jgi:hypothetical protein
MVSDITDNAIPLPGVSQIVTVTDWENVFGMALGSGVVPGVLNSLAASLDTSGRNAVVAPGAAMLQGFWKPVSAPTPTPIPAASSADRIDRLAMQLNRAATNPDLFVTPVVVTGTPGANPQEPALIQTPTGIWQMPIASWTSSSSGALSGLTDERHFGAQILSGVSGTRPNMAGPGIFFETDTGSLALWNGAAWQIIAGVPDIWHPLNPDNGFSGSIKGEVTPQYTAVVSVNGTLRGVAFRGVLDTPGNAAGAQVCPVLPGAYQPPVGNARWAVSDLTNTDAACHMVLSAAGQVIFQGVTAAGDQIDISGTAWIA